MILVDSTRGGKSIPDALSKTVPMWSAVINEAMRQQGILSEDLWQSHGKLVTPPKRVSETEHDQMSVLVPEMAIKLLVCTVCPLMFVVSHS
jgi:tRNA A64-2'-O-ribosylphosphate transferase